MIGGNCPNNMFYFQMNQFTSYIQTYALEITIYTRIVHSDRKNLIGECFYIDFLRQTDNHRLTIHPF